jgi:ferredoxin
LSRQAGSKAILGLIEKFLEGQDWKMKGTLSRKVGVKAFPVIDLGRCNRCEGCIEIAPEVFYYNKETGLIEIIDLPEYPVEKVNEAIKNCPEDCISWDK